MQQAMYSAKFEDTFFHHLAALVGMKTCFWMDNTIKGAIAYCYHTIGTLPAPLVKGLDDHANLIIYSNGFDLTKPVLYLSSHIDVVGAVETDWQYPAFEATVTGEYIIGRGVNDCKAGTAFQLALIDTIRDRLSDYNIGFMIMYREEGNQGKTSSYIDFSKLPTSLAGTYFMTLENTVSVMDDRNIEIGVYQKEPHNFFINVEGKLQEIQKDLEPLLEYGWRAVAIEPLIEDLNTLKHLKTLYNSGGGHSATQLNSTLIDAFRTLPLTNTAIKAGNIKDASVIAREINLFEAAENPVHSLVFNYRGFEAIKNVKKFLHQFNYKELFDFEYGLGADQSEAFNSSAMPGHLQNSCTGNTIVSITPNPGRSDASAIFNNLNEYQKAFIIPFACGPGCRSHTDKQNIKHSTHGENEGFYKPTAGKSIPFLLNIINKFKIK